ncbi:YdcF family protein [Pseudocolwellia sp. AS88]|uniref:YdcF family protein n=1 Tax=Pseudocolwellia sp. AS88 TaxID=3063958 RepID=UPI0026F237F3|nr:YdcF family protein [Pseudocolwellia sp. AS88]MDO7084421.1 YdcF family protein [Pseudocolwellia sp. AS88]
MSVAIVILGHINDELGQLSAIATLRCETALTALSFMKKTRNVKILCTGGFGKSFNTTQISHGQHLKNYLRNKGVSNSVFIDVALSTYTLEDALLSKPILEKDLIHHVVLVTSDFHMERAKLVFEHVIPNIKFTYAEAITCIGESVSQQELTRLIEHEKQAIKRDRYCC